jgi:GNAT superfamily N-acetyltransferase
MREVEIRPAKLKEISRVRYITKLAYKVPYKGDSFANKPHEPKDTEIKFSKKELFIFVAIVNEEIVGSVRCEMKNENQIYFHKLVVLKTYRKIGIGKKLVEAVERLAREKNCVKILLVCVREKKLDEYYLKMGYEIDGTKEHLGYHEVHMSKKLK